MATDHHPKTCDLVKLTAGMLLRMATAQRYAFFEDDTLWGMDLVFCCFLKLS